MIKNKSNSMPTAMDTWQPGSDGMGSNYVMPYTQGGPNPTAASAAVQLDPEMGFLPGSPVGGFTDNGVTHSSGTLDLSPSKGS